MTIADEGLSKSRSANSRLLVCLAFLALSFAGGRRLPAQPSATFSENARKLAARHLKSIETMEEAARYPSGSEEIAFVGQSRGTHGGWTVLVIHSDKEAEVLWDSSKRLRESYFAVMVPSGIRVIPGSEGDYMVEIRGCAPHQCDDGRFGYAVYSGRTRKLYKAKVTTAEDNSYSIQFVPQTGIPTQYLAELREMMCSDNGISHPQSLPFRCPPPTH